MTEKKTTYSTKDGKYTGKTETTKYDDGSSKSVNYTATKTGTLEGLVTGQNWKYTSTTNTDSKGDSQTTTSKK